MRIIMIIVMEDDDVNEDVGIMKWLEIMLL